jgi:hypothetical protein
VSDYRLLGASSYIGFFFTFQDENSQKERYGVDMWLAFFFFGLCSQNKLDVKMWHRDLRDLEATDPLRQ